MIDSEWFEFLRQPDGFFHILRAGDVLLNVRDKTTKQKVSFTAFTRIELPDSFGNMFVKTTKVSEFQLPCAIPPECQLLFACSSEISQLEFEFGYLPIDERLNFFHRIPKFDRLWYGETVTEAIYMNKKNSPRIQNSDGSETEYLSGGVLS